MTTKERDGYRDALRGVCQFFVRRGQITADEEAMLDTVKKALGTSCEHCDEWTPRGKRFCSVNCRRCEGVVGNCGERPEKKICNSPS